MTEKFFKYSKRVLAIDGNYTDWLIDYFRRQNQTKESLVTGYFGQDSNDLINAHDKKTFLGFYNLSPLVKRKQLIQKLFGINTILSFNLKLTIYKFYSN